jgi:hypothetical protein
VLELEVVDVVDYLGPLLDSSLPRLPGDDGIDP